MINEIDVDDSGTVDFEGLFKHSNKEKKLSRTGTNFLTSIIILNYTKNILLYYNTNSILVRKLYSNCRM